MAKWSVGANIQNWKLWSGCCVCARRNKESQFGEKEEKKVVYEQREAELR